LVSSVNLLTCSLLRAALSSCASFTTHKLWCYIWLYRLYNPTELPPNLQFWIAPY
jgi:hypothetical protein